MVNVVTNGKFDVKNVYLEKLAELEDFYYNSELSRSAIYKGAGFSVNIFNNGTFTANFPLNKIRYESFEPVRKMINTRLSELEAVIKEYSL